jgi:HEAT repeat protein
MPYLVPSGRAPRRCVSLLVLLVGAPALARGDELDSVMYSEPSIPVARVEKKYPSGLPELWLKALERPERDLRSSAALAIARAHEEGVPGMAATAPALLRLLDRADESTAVKAAAVRALAALGARDAAPAFFDLIKIDDPDLRDAAELALARWDHKPARDVWLARIGKPPPYRYDTLLAIRCLGMVREERAADRLRELALSPDTATPVRLAAASARAEIRRSGSEADATKLSADVGSAGRTNRLVAVALLRLHEGADAVKVLQQFARDPDPAVAVGAVSRLSELGSKNVLPVLADVMRNEGGDVRIHGVAAMIENPSDEYVRWLARTLSDPHPDVRVKARRGLHDLATDRKELVLEQAMNMLNMRDRPGQEQIAWRGQEQSAILLVQLDFKPAHKRLVELLMTNRSEVAAAVGWGLRKLDVRDTLPAVLAHVKARHQALIKGGPNGGLPGVSAEALDRQLSQLVQFIGQSYYTKAEPALIALLPRFLVQGYPPTYTPVGGETRGAAFWALGLFHKGKPDEDLVKIFEGRMIGDGRLGNDDPRVRQMAAIGLGRMGSKPSLELLQKYGLGTNPARDLVTNACRWSISQLTGEPAPPPGVIESPQLDWFLMPNK